MFYYCYRVVSSFHKLNKTFGKHLNEEFSSETIQFDLNFRKLKISLRQELTNSCYSQLASLSKVSMFSFFHFMNFDDHYLLLSGFLIAFLYLQIYFDW